MRSCANCALALLNSELEMLHNQVMRELWDIDLLIMVKPVRHYMNQLHLLKNFCHQ